MPRVFAVLSLTAMIIWLLFFILTVSQGSSEKQNQKNTSLCIILYLTCAYKYIGIVYMYKRRFIIGVGSHGCGG